MKSNTKNRTVKLCAAALGAALIAVCSWITVPMPEVGFAAPFTMQTFAVCLVSALLGEFWGEISVLVYIALGCIGVPVFAGFKNAAAVIAGPTWGYIMGFVLTAFCTGFICSRFGRKYPICLGAMAAGIILCYAVGTVWFALVYAKGTATAGFVTALTYCVVPYILPDLAKIAVASLICTKVFPRLGFMKTKKEKPQIPEK